MHLRRPPTERELGRKKIIVTDRIRISTIVQLLLRKRLKDKDTQINRTGARERNKTLTIIARRSGVSSLLPPNDDIPLSFSMISKSGSESIKYTRAKVQNGRGG